MEQNKIIHTEEELITIGDKIMLIDNLKAYRHILENITLKDLRDPQVLKEIEILKNFFKSLYKTLNLRDLKDLK